MVTAAAAAVNTSFRRGLEGEHQGMFQTYVAMYIISRLAIEIQAFRSTMCGFHIWYWLNPEKEICAVAAQIWLSA
jgi:hypothetical protein